MSATLNIVSKYDGRGVRKAKTDVKGLTKSALGVSLGIAGIATALVSLMKASSQAWMEDEKQASRLAYTLKNLGLGDAVTANEAFIASLEKSSGILDDELRPAYGRFVLATKDVAISQKLMKVAVDVSAGTGKDLSDVVNVLSRAMAGSRRGLLSLGTGIDETTLKSGKLTTIFGQLMKRFNGANMAQIGTKARMAADASVIISRAMESIGERVTNVVASTIVDLGKLWDIGVKFKEAFFAENQKAPLGGSMFMGKRIGWTASRPKGIAGVDAKKKELTLNQYLTQQDKKAATAKKQLNTEKAKSLQLTKLSAKYDLQLIGLAAAKKRNTGNAGVMGRLSDLTTLAQASAGLPVSASALAGAKNTQVPNVVVNVHGSVVTQHELTQMIKDSIAGGNKYGFGTWGGGL